MSKILDCVIEGETHTQCAVLATAVARGVRKHDAVKALNKAVKTGQLKYVGKGRPGPNRYLTRAQ